MLAATEKPDTGKVLYVLPPSLEKSKYSVPATSDWQETITSGCELVSHAPVKVAPPASVAVEVLLDDGSLFLDSCCRLIQIPRCDKEQRTHQ